MVVMRSQRELNTIETTSTHALSKTSYNKHQEVKG